MSTPQVVSLRSADRPAVPKPDPSRILSALGVALRELPARPSGFTACVAYLQDEPAHIAAKPISVRMLQKFRESLFNAPGRELEMRRLWRESLAAACCARSMALLMGLDAPLLTGAGLLHRLEEVLALRSLADAEFRAGQRLQGPVMKELAAAKESGLAERAIRQWSLTDALRDLLLQWRLDHSTNASPEAARYLAISQLLGFEVAHAGRSTPGAVEAMCDSLHVPLSLVEQMRSGNPGVELLLLRAAPPMGPVAAT